jgi:GT2 family glycosyltransferase
MPAPVTVLIPNFNGEKLLEECIVSALRQSLPPSEILVVDDASTDRSPQLAAELGARVIALPENRGFAHAVNFGVLNSDTEWVAIVNSDVTLACDWLPQLLDAAYSGHAAYACGPITRRDQPDILDGSYDLLSRAACPWRAGCGFPLAGLLPPDGFWLPSFTALLIRRDLFLEAGSLDETFGSYLEDVDFGLRIGKLEQRGLFVPTALASHVGSATFGVWSYRATRLQSRNQLLLVARHYPDGWFRRFGRAVVAGQLLWGLLALRKGVFRAWLLGKLDALRIWNVVRDGSSHLDADWLASSLAACERGILDWQGIRPRDSYWRWYFRLAGRGGS